MKEINKAIYFSFLIDILYNEEIYIKKISLLCIKATVELLLASLLFTTYMFSVRYIMGSVSSSSAPKIKTEDS